MSGECQVTLTFKSKEARDEFMQGLSDGWGENECQLYWHGDFDSAREFWVSPVDHRTGDHRDEWLYDFDAFFGKASGEVS
jgi:hypothetical protein